MKSFFISILLIALSSNFTHAQFGGLKNKLKQKISEKLEDKIVEELSDHIAERAFRPIDRAMDDWFKETYGADTTETGEVDWEKFNGKYESMLASMNTEANLPESYVFDISLEIETKDYSGDKHLSKLHFMKDKGIFGYEQMEGGDDFQFVVMDNENDLVAIYQMDDGKKTAQAIPSAMSMAKMFGASAAQNAQEDMGELKIEKTGKKEKFAGYTSVEFIGEDEEEKYKFYMAEDFPVSWMDAFGDFTKSYMSESYSEMVREVKGMVMYSETERKGNKKLKSTWEVKKVNSSGFTLNNVDWEIKKLGE